MGDLKTSNGCSSSPSPEKPCSDGEAMGGCRQTEAIPSPKPVSDEKNSKELLTKTEPISPKQKCPEAAVNGIHLTPPQNSKGNNENNKTKNNTDLSLKSVAEKPPLPPSTPDSSASAGAGKTAAISSKSSSDFYFLRIIGEGAFSTVYLGREVGTAKEYAIKVLTKSEVRREGKIRLVLREKDILVSLSYTYGGHPFIVKIFYAFQDAERLYFAVSYAKNGELLEILKRLGSFDEDSSLFYASEILHALDFLHNRCGIIHRDLKPENILVGADWHIILSDFGSAKAIGQQQSDGVPLLKNESPSTPNLAGSMNDDQTISPTKTLQAKVKSPQPLTPPPTATAAGKQRDARCSFVGTAHYISPEVLKSEDVGPECDYWALGAIIFQMISGQPPFRAVNEYKIMKKILDLKFEFPDGFPEIPRDLVRRLLVNNPADRLGSYETGGIGALKEHPFFKSISDWDALPTRTPPQLKPYLPASTGEPAFYSDLSEANEMGGDEECLTGNNIEPGYEAAQIRLMGFGKGRGSFAKIAYSDGARSDGECSVRHHSNGSATGGTMNMESLVAHRRREQLDKQRREHKFHRFVEDNLILKQGLIDKKKGLFARRRMFLLTEGPHLFYVDPVTMVLKGEIKFSPEMRTEAKNFRTFFIHTPNRTYYLFDPERHAKEWCDAIDWVKSQFLKPPVEQQTAATAAVSTQ